MTNAVLLTAFNRPALTKQVLDAIHLYQPARLFIALDGPRPARPTDVELCAEVHKIVENVDWSCDVSHLFRETNLGCQRAMTGAIDWFFEHVDEGIILEDDCLPSPGFFRFCDELLDKYRTDERVWMISGSNLLGTWRSGTASYHFAQGAVWGWATWRRAWQHADIELASLNSSERIDKARQTLGRRRWSFLNRELQMVVKGQRVMWGPPWAFTCASHAGLSAIPAVNLVRNIGMGVDATNMIWDPPWLTQEIGVLDAPLRHPTTVLFDSAFDRRLLPLEKGPLWWRMRPHLVAAIPKPMRPHLKRLYRSMRQRANLPHEIRNQ